MDLAAWVFGFNQREKDLGVGWGKGSNMGEEGKGVGRRVEFEPEKKRWTRKEKEERQHVSEKEWRDLERVGEIKLYIYNLRLKQNIIVTLDDYLLAIMMIEKLF